MLLSVTLIDSDGRQVNIGEWIEEGQDPKAVFNTIFETARELGCKPVVLEEKPRVWINSIVRRTQFNAEENTQTPILDLYSKGVQYRRFSIYLNDQEDIDAFEAMLTAVLEKPTTLADIPVVNSGTSLQRKDKGVPNSQEFILPRNVGVQYYEYQAKENKNGEWVPKYKDGEPVMRRRIDSKATNGGWVY